MPVTIYTSEDAGAPPLLPNAAGSLIAVLDACLVNGYGAKAGAGWSKPFSDVNLAAYKQGAGSNGMYCRIDDSSGATARVRGFENMTAVSTGTAPFPTDAQVSGGDYILKHDTGGGSRKWMVIANHKAFYFWTQFDTRTDGLYAGLTFFGDIKTRKPGDAFHTMLMAANGVTKNSETPTGCNDHGGAMAPMNRFCYGHYLARSYTQVGGSVEAAKRPETQRFMYNDYGRMDSYGFDWPKYYVFAPIPSPVNGALYLSPVVVSEYAAAEDRGQMPGLWNIDHIATFNPGDTFNAAVGYHAGKTFVVLAIFGAHYALEITDTWD